MSEQQKYKKQNLIIFQGDSVTDAGCSKEEDSCDYGKGYVSLIATKVGVDYCADNYKILNKGVGGDRIVDFSARWEKDVINQHPQIVSILIGVNDSYGEYSHYHNGVTHDKFKKKYAELLDETIAINPKCQFVLCEPFSMPASLENLALKIKTPDKANSDLIGKQKIVRALAEKYDTCFVPLQTLFDKVQKQVKRADYWILDGFHPSIFGHEIIARQWLSCATYLLK